MIWSGVHHAFDELPAHDAGFVHPQWLEKSIARLHAEQAAETPDPHPSYRITDVVLAVTGGRGSASVLDVGGNLGQTGLDVRRRLPRADIAWTVLEREDLLAAAAAVTTLPSGIEFVTEASALDDRRFDAIHLGSVLQYFEDWRGGLAGLVADRMRPGSWMVISDAMSDRAIPSFVTAQRYYEASLRMHFLNLDELLAHLEDCGLEPILVEPYLTPHTSSYYPELGLPAEYRIRHPHNLVLRAR